MSVMEALAPSSLLCSPIRSPADDDGDDDDDDQVTHHVPPKSRLGSDHTSKQSSSESAREDILK